MGILGILGTLVGCGSPEDAEVPADVLAGTGQAEPFLPGIAEPGAPVESIALSADGRSVFLIRGAGAEAALELTHWSERGFTPPVRLPFYGPHRDRDPHISPDDEFLYFSSDRPMPGAEAGGIFNLWRAARSPDGWREPEAVPGVNDPAYDDRGPAVGGDGTLAFSSTRPGGQGGSDIWLARAVGGTFTPPENPGPPLNSVHDEADPYLAPDASFLLLVRRQRPSPDNPEVHRSAEAGGEILLTLRQDDGTWSSPEPLGGGLGSHQDEYAPFVSPGGEYLFFNRGPDTIWWVPSRTAGLPLESR